MGTGQILTDDRRIREVLIRAHTIALLGLSPKPDRDSYQVAAYLKDHGYRIIPVRPAQVEILGEKAYPSLDDLPGTVDIIDAFRSPEQILAHAREALRLRPLVFWMQAGIANPEAAGLLTAAGIDVVMDRCIKHEHERLFGNVTL
ncbi:MAG: CoA-binding protein [Deltaproteobacteria bacterium]|nr:CoA-binding protein [Deltaproteobacteria bacterium]